MKKTIFFSLVGILLYTVFCLQAYAGYIIWWGDRTGTIPTGETSRTNQAASELFNQLFPDRIPHPSGTCLYWFHDSCFLRVSDYCIGCDGPVRSVCLFSDVSIEKIDKIYLDHHSRTSVELLRVYLGITGMFNLN